MRPETQVDLSAFQSQLTFRNKLVRAVWGWVWLLFFRPSPRLAFGWRRWLLRCWGARVAKGVRVYPSVRVYYPPHLELMHNAIVGPDVDLYCVDQIVIEANAMISQYSYLCTASHDYSHPGLPLVTAPIRIGTQAWICADVFVGPGVNVGAGAVVGARSTVFKDVEAWAVVAGNPAKKIKERELK
ncbi:MAG TPA: hypothetical protein PKD54_05440 [Pirellulaceae bacterium]|nr:hypothetical protein [Pirellulaceae bacterium]